MRIYCLPFPARAGINPKNSFGLEAGIQWLSPLGCSSNVFCAGILIQHCHRVENSSKGCRKAARDSDVARPSIMRKSLRLVAALVVAVGSVLQAVAQTNAFTYQGRLLDSGQAASGVYDFQFSIYDAGSGGTLVSSVLTNEDVNVSNGLFTVTLDFGAGMFNGASRWLDIGVRPGTNTGTFMPLTPRQALTSVPYAQYALTPAGPPGPSGPSGIVTNVFVTGSVGTQPTNGTFVFAGPTTAQVALTAGRRVFVTVSAMIGTTAIGETFDFSVAYSLNGGLAILPYPLDWLSGRVTGTGGRQSYTHSAIFTVPNTGNYTFGFGLRNNGPNSLNDCDWLSVSAIVLN